MAKFNITNAETGEVVHTVEIKYDSQNRVNVATALDVYNGLVKMGINTFSDMQSTLSLGLAINFRTLMETMDEKFKANYKDNLSELMRLTQNYMIDFLDHTSSHSIVTQTDDPEKAKIIQRFMANMNYK